MEPAFACRYARRMRTAAHRRLLRSVLLLALCAWAAFALEAVAQPLRMLAAAPAAAHVAAADGHTGCASMSDGAAAAATGQHPPSAPAAGHAGAAGHADCCTQGACACASAPGVPATVPGAGMDWSVLEARAPSCDPSDVPRAWPTSLLRPPIA